MDRSFKWEINYRAWKFESTLHTSGCSRPGLSSDSISEKTAMFCCVTPRSPLTFATCSGCMSARGGIFHCSQYYVRICFRGDAIWIRFKTTRSALTCRSCKEFLKEVLLLYMSARTHLLFWIMHLKTVPRFTWGVLSSMSVCHKVQVWWWASAPAAQLNTNLPLNRDIFLQFVGVNSDNIWVLTI